MTASLLTCKNEQRRHQVRHKKGLNGLDYLEVSGDQLTLSVYFLGKAPPNLDKENIRIQGGRRITNIQVRELTIYREEDEEIDDTMCIVVDKAGDFSTYRLCLIDIDAQSKKPLLDEQKQFRPLHGFDPRYACLDFNFKVSCPSDLDCKSQATCPPEKREEPDISYLAKDYASFRQLILDRMALTLPDWQERHIPDLGITLVELLAYMGDQLSYYQDAVATEAYLDTARRRVSVRRHARLVDYQLHEGCNARTWVTFQVSQDITTLKPAEFYLITDPSITTLGNSLLANQLPNTVPKPYLVFEPLVENPQQPIAWYAAHNEITIYTWEDAECCLPKGSTSATLVDSGVATQAKQDDKEQTAITPQESDYRLKLKPCDVIIFEEVKGSRTGNKADADTTHRHAVRLTKATKNQDTLTGKLIWDIEWAVEDALPFPLCLSSIKEDDCSLISQVSVVRGNVLLIDHGETIKADLIPDVVPLETIQEECGDGCAPREAIKIAGRFEPHLSKPDVTFSQPLPPCKLKPSPCTTVSKLTPASALLKQDVRLALPQVKLRESDKPLIWEARLDLLSSTPNDRHFVVEMENDRQAQLRFGNGDSGRFPNAETHFQADYRIGNGAVGNVGFESITHIVFRKNLLSGINIALRNPLPAKGGVDPEPIAEAKLFAPHTFRKELQRAITADDYAQIVMRDFASKVQRAAAKLRWTGSWFEVLVAIDPLGSEDTNEELLCEIKQHLYRYRRIGHDVVVVQANYVALDIAMTICVSPHYLRGQVKSAVLDVFSNRTMRNGNKAFFHPDNLSFGEGIYLSKLVATAQAVVGVESVIVTKLERLFAGSNQEIDNGLLPLSAFEVARLDSDPSFPENGKFTLDMRGGR